MRPLDPLNQQERERALRRMKSIPLILLGLMIVLFVATLHRPEAWAGWVHAFAEAGMVGALADWFAVVALFRYPLGIPIPHTAIIPNRKDALGEAMARFVSDHFLEPRAVRAKLETINLAEHTVNWLQSGKGQARLLDFADAMIRWALDALDEKRVRKFLSRLSKQQLERLDLAPLLGHTIDWMVKGDKHQDVFTQVLRYSIIVLNDHRELIRERVKEGSPWWVPGFVDERILKQMLEKIETRLYEMSLDLEHPAREQFNSWLIRLAEDLKVNPEHRMTADRFKQQLLENEELLDYLYGLWEDLSNRLREDLDAEDSKTRSEIASAIERFANELASDVEMKEWISGWMMDSVVSVVDANRTQIASLISDTVKTWDGVETSKRVELALGKDLQFIRINGTLVGGLVGLVIHAVKLATA